MTVQSDSSFQKLIDAVKERPGSYCAAAAGAGFAIGLLAAPFIVSAGSSTQRLLPGLPTKLLKPKTAGEDNQRQNAPDGNNVSGTSTPASTMTCDSSVSFLSRELDERLDYSFAFVYRNDLAMGKGRLAALCVQASIAQYKKLYKGKSQDLKLWEKGKKEKLCLQAEDEAHFLQVESAAISEGLPIFKLKDTGSSGRRTPAVMAIGPAKTSRIREATSNLKISR